MAAKETLLLRADAGPQIGIGHLMRCLALAQAWQSSGGRATFLSHCPSNNLHHRIKAADIGLIDLNAAHPNPADLSQTLNMLQHYGARWLVLDGYHFDPAYQQAIRTAGYRLMVIDDMAHWSTYHADIILNQNINAGELTYQNDPDTTLLLGTQYILLRPEFLAWRGWQREISEPARNVLVTLGGSDPGNVTLKVIEALRRLTVSGLEVKVIVGPTNPHFRSLQAQSDFGVHGNIHFITNAANIPELMAWADMAVSAGGSTSWELAFMGVPSITLILADNQRAVAEILHKQGIVLNLGWYEHVTSIHMAQTIDYLLQASEIRRGMATAGQNLLDGEGIDRVLMQMRGQKIRLRPVYKGDERLIWRWANDPEVRANSFSSEPIPWEQHQPWFRTQLNDPNCVFYLAINQQDIPIGQIRYNLKGDEAVISVSLDEVFRGQGCGSNIIALASHHLFGNSEVRRIHSYIKTGNEPSIKSFLKAGFKQIETTMIKGQQAIHLTQTNEELK
jgi:UDP-2,4-diacetamido-2,4,6-trideoxy-beta-L-altropyranose hydrolase